MSPPVPLTTEAPPPAEGPPARLEWLLALGLVLIGLALRVPDLARPFDRHFDGFQGAFFAIGAVNYERLGIAPTLGYPVADPLVDPERPATWYLYPNHPPTVGLLAWASMKALAPDGWQEAWRRDEPPVGVETSVRLPFFLAQILGLVGLVLALRATGARRAALWAGVFYAWAPITTLYGGLANYENPSLAPLLLGVAGLVAWARHGSKRGLALASICTLLSVSVTFAPVFFLPFLCFWMLGINARRALIGGACLVPASLLPLLVHGSLAARAGEIIGATPDTIAVRANKLLGPLLDGRISFGYWLGRQGHFMELGFGIALLLLAGLGLCFGLAAALRPNRGDGAPAPLLPLPVPLLPAPLLPRAATGLALALTAGGALVLFGFFRHTAGSQDPFQLNLAPGLCAFAGLGFAALLGARRAPAPARLAGCGLALAAALTATQLHTSELRQLWRLPGPADDPSLQTGNPAALPVHVGPELASLVPADSVVLHPDALGFSYAVNYYAWRNLMAVAPGAYPLLRAKQLEYGKDELPAYLVLPKRGSPLLLEQSEALRRDLLAALAERGGDATPTAENANWTVYRIR